MPSKWRGKVWFKKTGLFNNARISGWAIKFHARLRMVDEKVKLMSRGIVYEIQEQRGKGTADQKSHLTVDRDVAKDAQVDVIDADCTTGDTQTDNALDVLRTLESFMMLGFAIKRGEDLTVAQLCQHAGRPWQAFFEGYLQGRSNAIK